MPDWQGILSLKKQIINTYNMEKYITKDKIADFVMKMWEQGVSVDLRSNERKLIVTKKYGSYEFIPVYEEASYDELISSCIRED